MKPAAKKPVRVPYVYWSTGGPTSMKYWTHDDPTCRLRATLEGRVLHRYITGTNPDAVCKVCNKRYVKEDHEAPRP